MLQFWRCLTGHSGSFAFQETSHHALTRQDAMCWARIGHNKCLEPVWRLLRAWWVYLADDGKAWVVVGVMGPADP